MILRLLIIVFVFYLMFSKRWLYALISAFFMVFILTGSLNESYNRLPINIKDFFTIVIWLLLTIYFIVKKRKFVTTFFWPDKLLLGYFIVVLIIPLFLQYFVRANDYSNIFKYFLPVKLWFVYRIFYYIYMEQLRKKVDINQTIFLLLRIFLYVSLISAAISLLRYFPLFKIQSFIEQTWPIMTNGRQVSIEKWGRLWSTMSGTNGSGSFYGLSAFISFYLFMKIKNIKFFYFFILFTMCLLLSGSFSSGIGFIVVMLIFSRSKLNIKTVSAIAFSGIAIYFLITSTSFFSSAISKRYSSNFRESNERIGILPSNLSGRIGYWTTNTRYLFSENVVIQGFGPGGIRDFAETVTDDDIHGNPESFYLAILLESGIFALAYLLFFLYYIYKKSSLNIHKNHEYAQLFKFTIIMVSISNVANLTLYYGGNLEMFCFALSSIFIIDYTYKIEKIEIQNMKI